MVRLILDFRFPTREIQNLESKIRIMLAELNISNFAIIDKLYLRLGSGFNALTGETGAGKSIIIDALGALLGSKTGPEFVRHGSQSARVEGLFDLASMHASPRESLRGLLVE